VGLAAVEHGLAEGVEGEAFALLRLACWAST
jgi:hypothetical protein